MTKATLTTILHDLAEEMCDNYCKYPLQYQMEHEDSEMAYENMLEEICSECPLTKLL